MAGVVCAVDEAGGRPQLRGLTPPDTAALVCDAAEAALTAVVGRLSEYAARAALSPGRPSSRFTRPHSPASSRTME